MPNPFKQLQDLYKKPQLIPAEVVQVKRLSSEDKRLIQRIGLTAAQVRRDLQKDIQIQYDRMSLYHQVERCLRGDTRIWLLDNTSPTIEEIVGDPDKYVEEYTFSINPDTLEIEPDKIISAQKTRLNAQLVRVHLDNGKYVDCTPDHRFMLRDGTYREAQDLKPDDSLMPLTECLLNHKVIKVEWLEEREDTYDITTEKNHNFSLEAGVFVHNSLEHWLVAAAAELYGNYCCLTGDTKIPLLDGRTLTIKEILQEQQEGKENWVYSCDYKGKPQPSKILHAIKQPHKPKTFRIWLDNGKYVDASDNHRFVKRDGSLCRADELEVGDSLMPFHRTHTRNGYEMVWDVEKKNWEATYRIVAQHFCDIDLKEANKGKSVADDTCLIVHHKWDEEEGFNKSNNNPDRLEIITSKEHREIHNKVLVERWKDPAARELQGRKMEVLNQDPEFRRASKEGHNTPEYKEKMQPYWEKQKRNKERGKKISVGRKAYWDSLTLEERQRVPRETRTCMAPDCNTTFVVPVTSSRQYCCSGHGRRGKTYSSPKKGKFYTQREMRTCALPSCNNTFEVMITSDKRFCSSRCANRDPGTNKKRGKAISRTKAGKSYEEMYGKRAGGIKLRIGKSVSKTKADKKKELVPSNNHKIVKIEYIGEKEVYDISVDGSQLFGLDIGIYIHNTVYSPLHNATVWITSESPTYQKELTKLLDRIGIEEKIFDWAYSTGAYGDLFVKVTGIPGQGVVAVDDSQHPLNMSRVDHEGTLIGYYKTPLGQISEKQDLIPPWEYIHFRLLGGKKKRPRFGDQMYSEFRTVHLLVGTDIRQVTTKYGTSLLLNALPSYRRLRLAEDSLLLARLSRGIVRYIWKLKVSGENMEAIGELVDQYSQVLREARALNTRPDEVNFESKEEPMSVIEDLFVPVWGGVGDLTYDKIGGEVDIRWIKDIEELRDQLAASLRTPLPLLGAYTREATGPLGSQAIEKLDINFARAARKLQRAVRNGIKRLCQIHLAYMNMDPDPNLFDVQMPEMSTAEEESLMTSLSSGIEIVDKMMDMVERIEGQDSRKIDRIEVFNFLNDKFLKLEDFNLSEFVTSPETIPECKRRKDRKLLQEKARKVVEAVEKKSNGVTRRGPQFDLDLFSYVPTTIYTNTGNLIEKRAKKIRNWLGTERCIYAWKERFATVQVIEGDIDEDVQKGQMTLWNQKNGYKQD